MLFEASPSACRKQEGRLPYLGEESFLPVGKEEVGCAVFGKGGAFLPVGKEEVGRTLSGRGGAFYL